MLAVPFTPPPVNPAPNGLYGATQWTPETGPTRWLDGGVQIRPAGNYGGETSFGVWNADWCASLDDLTPDDRKAGLRPENPAPFEAMTVWAADECDLTEPSQTEVHQRAAQVFRLEEQNAVERQFAARLLTDSDNPGQADDIVDAVSQLEDALGRTNTQGFIHASTGWAARAAQANLLIRSGTGLTTPLGHRWVFGGGYIAGLTSTLMATSQPFGWRSDVQVRTATDERANSFIAIAERSVVVGYERLVGAVEIG
ncbi:hypothetical protein [Mycolicibacterium sp. HK-90]|uniref:hypothetical protein n=1 Tax=Mycolicibacterium sp. HK-90 TaxID=3056937 RepID=UPI002659FB55|nr:hypothetical protein [Mycolicibacterium sp. HK-90]WKG06634.1 hypothetical protein QU592_19140 [Mycolicibacterium sp. HK-90]